jgi:hypothetical protein
MDQPAAMVSIKLVGCAVVAAWSFSIWLQTPVLEVIGIQSWRWIGLALAVMIGGLGTALTRHWLRVSGAAGIGWVIGATWVEFSHPNDLKMGLLLSFLAGVQIFYREISLFVVGASAGGLIVGFFRKPPKGGHSKPD